MVKTKDAPPSQLTCAICLDLMSSPVALPCGHCLDRECLVKAVDAECPLCREAFNRRAVAVAKPVLIVMELAADVAATTTTEFASGGSSSSSRRSCGCLVAGSKSETTDEKKGDGGERSGDSSSGGGGSGGTGATHTAEEPAAAQVLASAQGATRASYAAARDGAERARLARVAENGGTSGIAASIGAVRQHRWRRRLEDGGGGSDGGCCTCANFCALLLFLVMVLLPETLSMAFQWFALRKIDEALVPPPEEPAQLGLGLLRMLVEGPVSLGGRVMSALLDWESL